MSGGLLARYANQSYPPELRAALFVNGEPRLTWTSLFHDEFPNADIYLVGGTLRDSILGKIPEDIDIVIRGVSIEKLQSWLQSHGAYEIAGSRFGTFKFSPHGCASLGPIDIALPRREKTGDEHFSGRSDMLVDFDPSISIRDDLSRRDFTVNALAFDLRFRKLIDPFDGLHDLHTGIIRAVGAPSERFYEDATRVLRGMRFASQLGFAIEEHTWKAMKDSINLINNTRMREDGRHEYVVPREVIGKEFLLGFVNHPTHTLRLWDESGALGLFLPSVDALKQYKEKSGETAFEKTIATLHILERPSFLELYRADRPSPTLLVAALFAHLEGELTDHARRVCKGLYFHQFPKRTWMHVRCEDVLWLVDMISLLETQDPASMRPSTFERTFLNDRGRELMMLMHARHIASGKHSIGRERLHTARRIAERMAETVYSGDGRLAELITGKDLQSLGITPGPEYREIKNMVRDAQLTHRIHTKEEAIDLVRLEMIK